MPGEQDLAPHLRRAAEGDPQSIDILFSVLYKRLRMVAKHKMAIEGPRAMGGPGSDPLELVHEAFVRYRTSPFSAENETEFLGKMARRMAWILMDRAREMRGLRRGMPDPEPLQAAGDVADPQSVLEDKRDRLVNIRILLEELREENPDAAATIELVVAGYTREETASFLGKTAKAVRALHDRAIRWIRSNIEGKPQPQPLPERIELFFATDRNIRAEQNAVSFGGDRSDAARVYLGRCVVDIPRNVAMGKLDAPRLVQFKLIRDADRHVTIRKVETLPREVFYKRLRERIEESSKPEALVFIHGYNVTFDDAVLSTAKLASDLRFEGAPILYSWPSAGFWTHYPGDENNVEWSTPHFEDFLRHVSAKTGATTIHLIAHSMGNRALVHALRMITASAAAVRVKHIVLAAPDIDAQVLAQLSGSLRDSSERVTMYVSTKDRALVWSRRFHGGYPRAGERLLILNGVDTIDASLVDTSFLGHSYITSKRSVLGDLFYLIRAGTPPEDRSELVPEVCEQGKYFRFRA
jgi:esterase/lipase superfamily enzyme/DNA-directed RNA polymerase specialized sigma24 family protein